MEAIAKKSNSCVGFMILCFLLAAASLTAYILFAVYAPSEQDEASLLLVLFVVLIPVGIYYATKVRLPENLILFDDKSETLILYDGRTLLLNGIEEVTYKRSHSRYGTYGFGAISFTLKDGEDITISPVADVEETGVRLSKMIYGNNK